MNSDDQIVAIHESAHAVVAALAGMDVRRVVLSRTNSGGEPAGFCELHDANDERDNDMAGFLRLVLAGSAAERRLLGRYTERDADDVATALTLSRAITDDWTEEGLKARATFSAAQAIVNAQMLDDSVWEWVERVAKALIVRRQLSGRDIQELREGRR